MRQRGEEIHGGTRSLVGWSVAAYGDHSAVGKCLLGYFIGLMSSTLSGLCHIIQRTSKYTRKLVKSSLAGEVRWQIKRQCFGDFLRTCRDLFPGVAGFEGCESLFTHLRGKKISAEKFSVRHFAAIQPALGTHELGNSPRLQGLGNPADGLTRSKSDMALLLRVMESGK